MKKTGFLILLLAIIMMMMPHCRKTKPVDIVIPETCQDNKKNQNETDVDCGGVCAACITCADGIKNQGETDIDCGGPCGLCPITYPKHGLYGPNLLHDSLVSFVSGVFPPNSLNKPYSLACKLPSATSIKVRITCLSSSVNATDRPWAYDVSSVGTWKIISNGTAMDFYNESETKPDLKLTFWGNGTGKIEIFENESETATRTKLISWNE